MGLDLLTDMFRPVFRGEVRDQEWRFLLTGGVALENPFPNPASSWLTDKSWAEIVRCSQLPAFDGLMDQFQKQVLAYSGVCKLDLCSGRCFLPSAAHIARQSLNRHGLHPQNCVEFHEK